MSKNGRGMRPTFIIDQSYHCKLMNIYCKVHVGNNAEYFFTYVIVVWALMMIKVKFVLT